MRVAIANRGEVAVRIIRACQELGHQSVLLHSTPDKNTTAYRLADETVELPGSTPQETYLNHAAVLDAAKKADVKALHPGFGFLSENADFAEEVTSAGIIFIGPFAASIRAAGNKMSAKHLAQKAKVPVLPAFEATDVDPKKVLGEAKKMGFPVIVKAASGGGGKGMKVVRKEDELFELISSAQREALGAFGSREVFVEKYLPKPRHIEVQILGDQKDHMLHFFERECSVQRRHQKIFEETPSSSLTSKLRAEITSAALRIARAADYTNAGTVEFLLDGDKFYFMELNTRLQVEHTVTEMVCGVDLVHLQFFAAMGEALPFPQEQISQTGHALEVRVYAEDPAREFLPSTGKIERLRLPLGPGRRFDFGFSEGDEITPYYDPMIGKIVTWAPTRAENLQRMIATLNETVIFGVHTNIEFLKDVLSTKKFQANELNTSFLQETYKDGFKLPPLTPAQLKYAGAVKIQASKGAAVDGAHSYQSPWSAPWTNLK